MRSNWRSSAVSCPIMCRWAGEQGGLHIGESPSGPSQSGSKAECALRSRSTGHSGGVAQARYHWLAVLSGGVQPAKNGIFGSIGGSVGVLALAFDLTGEGRSSLLDKPAEIRERDCVQIGWSVRQALPRHCEVPVRDVQLDTWRMLAAIGTLELTSVCRAHRCAAARAHRRDR